jgi:two-component system, sensor histidine kinase ChiS
VQQNERLQAEADAAQAKSEAKALRSHNQLRWLGWISTLSVALLGTFAFWQRARRLQRRIADAKKLAGAQQQYRAAANALRAQDERQHAMLELIADASAIVDVNGQIERVNRAFAQALACAPSELVSQPISTWLPELPLAVWQQLTGRLDEAETGTRARHCQLLQSGKELQVQGLGSGQLGFLVSISQPTSGGTSGGHGSTHLQLYPPAKIAVARELSDQADADLTQFAPSPNIEAAPNPNQEAAPQATLEAKLDSAQATQSSEKPRTDELEASSWDSVEQRQRLVALMLSSLQAFERSTGKTRIELAERSKLWRVTIDDGRLRVRAMERYLSLQKLPKVPRWREVLRTAYFVLAECGLSDTVRAQLEAQLEEVQTHLNQSALLTDVEA